MAGVIGEEIVSGEAAVVAAEIAFGAAAAGKETQRELYLGALQYLGEMVAA